MAGGMRTGRGLTLAERSALSGVAPEPPEARAGRSRRRHCWVAPASPALPPCPGLVLDWQRTDAGWRAYVVYLRDSAADGGGEGVAVQEWVDADRLTPAVGSPHHVDSSQ